MTEKLHTSPTHTPPLSLHLQKGKHVVVRLKDHISCGAYRGNGTYWYVYGRVGHVSRRYGYAQVTYTDRWGRVREGDVFTWSGLGAFHSTIDPKNRSCITIHRTTEDRILLPLDIEYTDIMIRQDLIEQIRETPYTDWEHLTIAQLWEVVHLIMKAKKEDIKE